LLSHAETIAVNCANSDKLPDCLSAIALKSQPFGRKVWVLYSGLSMALLSMPSVQVEGVDEAILGQLLQYELEGLTGQSTMDMQLAYQLLSNQDEMSQYSVSQINRLTLTELTKAVKKGGGRLRGLMHPAGLPLFVQDATQEDWLRLEGWSQQWVALRKIPDTAIDMQVFALSDRQWRGQLEKWFVRQGLVEQSETLLNNSFELLPETHYTRQLSTVDAALPWLLLWAGLLVKPDLPAVPLLRYQSKLNADLLLMASGGVTALMLCLAHFAYFQYQTVENDTKFKDLQKIETVINGMKKTLATDQENSVKLKTTIDKLKSDSEVLPRLIQGLQDRPVKLLQSLAKGRPQNLLLESIETNKDEIKIVGISLDSTSPNELGTYLEQHLALLGWAFVAPTKKNMGLMPGGGPWEFEIKLRDLGVDGFLRKPS
jgi:Tfp pilus assembly protein PilN